MEVALELIIMDTIVRVLCQCLYLYVVNGGCFRADNDLVCSEMIVRVVCHCLYVVNGGCFRADNDRNDCESALPPLVRSEWTLLGS